MVFVRFGYVRHIFGNASDLRKAKQTTTTTSNKTELLKRPFNDRSASN